jgi:hypothetical protein
MHKLLIVFILISCFSFLLAQSAFQYSNGFTKKFNYNKHSFRIRYNYPDIPINRIYFQQEEKDSLLDEKSSSTFILGFGGGYFLYPYLELGFQIYKLYLTGELCFMFLGGYASFVCIMQMIKTDIISYSFVLNYGRFSGIGITEPITIKGGGIEVRLELSRENVQGILRGTLQRGYNSRSTPWFQAGIRFLIY